jgi:putative nucleotidyltransferase with HDIG domain
MAAKQTKSPMAVKESKDTSPGDGPPPRAREAGSPLAHLSLQAPDCCQNVLEELSGLSPGVLNPAPEEQSSDQGPVEKPEIEEKGDIGKSERVPESAPAASGSSSDFLARYLVILVGFAALVVALIANHILYPGPKLGDIADRDIKARQSAWVIDQNKTQEAQERARHSIMPVLKEDTSHYNAFLVDVSKQLDRIHALQMLGLTPSANLTPDRHLALLEGAAFEPADHLKAKSSEMLTVLGQREICRQLKRANNKFTSDELYISLSVNPEDWGTFRNKVISASLKMCRVIKRFPVDDNRFWHETVVELLSDQWPLSLKNRIASSICSALQPNLVIDQEATRKKGDQVVAGIKPTMMEIIQGTVVLHKGELVTEDNLATLNNVGAATGINWLLIFSLALSIAAAVGLIGMFLSTYEAQYFYSAASLGLIFTVCVITTFLATAIGKQYPEFVPLPMATLVLTIFFGRRTALVVVLPLLALLACDRVIDLNNLIALGASSGAAIGTYSKKRHDIVSSGLIIGMMQALGYISSLAIIPTATSLAHFARVVALELFGGITSAMFAIGLLPFLENMFGMLTPFRLSELVHPDQPLLRRLQEEAPGTYQHSLAVANLAEGGAHAIKADASLVRAGALYHDIGKMVRPKYFIENQLGDKNPHDTMTPEESRERVLGHVTDGVALANKYALPKAVKDFIPMHQGTCLMAYFYHKACLRDGPANVDPGFYRYPGPKPQSKETAIVMLADVSEAVTHSMVDPKELEVDESLTKVFENRWQDGQLNQSGLTYSELQKVKEAFLRVWRTLHHERVKYPATTTGRMPIPPEGFSPI